jgi:hypothetical protein
MHYGRDVSGLSVVRKTIQNSPKILTLQRERSRGTKISESSTRSFHFRYNGKQFNLDKVH